MTPPIVQRLRDAAASIRDERVSMRAMAQAHGALRLLPAMALMLIGPGLVFAMDLH